MRSEEGRACTFFTGWTCQEGADSSQALSLQTFLSTNILILLKSSRSCNTTHLVSGARCTRGIREDRQDTLFVVLLFVLTSRLPVSTFP